MVTRLLPVNLSPKRRDRDCSRVLIPVYIQLHHKDITDRELHCYHPEKKSQVSYCLNNEEISADILSGLYGSTFRTPAGYHRSCHDHNLHPTLPDAKRVVALGNVNGWRLLNLCGERRNGGDRLEIGLLFNILHHSKHGGKT